METDLTKGNITKSLLLFSLPMILGNLLQQLYNVADTFIVGKYIGSDALAGSRIFIYNNDVFDFDYFRFMYGKRYFIFDVIWS